MNSYLVSDMFTRIRNAKLCGHKIVTVTSTKLTRGIATVLLSEGILDDLEDNVPFDAQNYLILSLNYANGKNKTTWFKDIQSLSKPGSRKYSRSKKIPKLMGGLATIILSTSKGIMTDKEATKKNIGGELLGYFF